MFKKKRKAGKYPAYLRSVSRVPTRKEQGRPFVLVAIGMYRYPHPLTVAAVWKMLGHFQGTNREWGAVLTLISGSGLTKMRSDAVRQMLEMPDCQALLFIDDDMNFPVGVGKGRDGQDQFGFNPLTYMLDLDKDMVGALAFTRNAECRPVVGDEDTQGRSSLNISPEVLSQGEPFRKDFVGFGMVLIRRKVVEGVLGLVNYNTDALFRASSNWQIQADIKHKWAKLAQSFKDGEIDADRFAQQIDWLKAEADELGEDFSFCRRAREAGFEVWVTPKFDCTHIGDYQYGRLDWEARLQFMKREQEEGQHEPQGARG